MAKTNAISFFNPDNWSQGGGGIFTDGRYRITARFGTYDFGKAGEDRNVGIIIYQPINEKGKAEGETKTQYYSLGKGIDLCNPVKGEKGMYSGIEFAEDAEFDKLWGGADFVIFLQHLKDAGYDVDAADDDITVLDGLEGDFAKFAVPGRVRKYKDKKTGEDKEGPYEVIVCTGLDKKASGKSADKGKAAKEEPKAKDKGKAAKKDAEVGDDPEEIVDAYLEANLNDDAEGSGSLVFKMGITKYATKELDKSADVARAAQALLKENFDELLSAKGWEVNNSKLARA